LLECLCLGQRSGNIAGLLVEAARDPTRSHLWTASCPEQAATTVEHAREVKQCRLPIVDQPACRRENLARWADINVTLLVEREGFPTECPIVAFRLVDHRNVRCDLLVLDEPIEGRVCLLRHALRARESGRRDGDRPARAGWAVQRLLAARFDGEVAGGAVAGFLFSDIPVRGDDGARAIGATDDAAAVELPGRRRRHPGSKAALEG